MGRVAPILPNSEGWGEHHLWSEHRVQGHFWGPVKPLRTSPLQWGFVGLFLPLWDRGWAGWFQMLLTWVLGCCGYRWKCSETWDTLCKQDWLQSLRPSWELCSTVLIQDLTCFPASGVGFAHTPRLDKMWGLGTAVLLKRALVLEPADSGPHHGSATPKRANPAPLQLMLLSVFPAGVARCTTGNKEKPSTLGAPDTSLFSLLGSSLRFPSSCPRLSVLSTHVASVMIAGSH